MARHSTGCRNCVRRRVRCDKRQPNCKNCEKRRLTCGGSQEGHFFVNQHLEKHQDAARKIPTQSLPEYQYHCDLTVIQESPSTSPGWSKYATDTQFYYLQYSWDNEDQPWIGYCIGGQDKYPVAFLALKALAGAYFGRRTREHSIITSACGLYGRALTALQTALGKVDRSSTFDILTASTALQRYEALVCTTGTGWIKHSGGIAKAIEMSGPECFQNYPNKAILDANRYRIIQEAYHHRRRTFLAEEKWATWRSYDGSQAAHFSQLQDLYARVTGLTEGVTNFLSGAVSEQDSLYEILNDEVDGLLAELDYWMIYWTWTFEFKPTEKFDTADSGGVYHSDAGPIFESSLHYPTRQAAIGSNICRVLKLTTLEWRYKLLNPTWREVDKQEELVGSPATRELAVDICRTLHSHFDNSKSAQGMYDVYSLLFCATVAYRTFSSQSREADWIRKFLYEVADRSAVELARRLVAQSWKE